MAYSAKKELSKQELFIEQVLAEFAKKFSSPSFEISSTRCISKALLLKHLIAIRNQLEFPGYKRLSAKDILLHLERSKIIRQIKTRDPKTMKVQEKFYLLGLSSKESMVDPIELLQALEPKGVICYFTALEYYGLTTQIPSHHHVAKLVKNPLGKKNKDTYTYAESSKKRAFDPLGTQKFIYEDIPYYLTKRTENLIPGIKERFLNERTKFYITTVEQTLLDTLHKPLSCGGSPVIFEAWKNAINKTKSNIILEYLNRIDNVTLSCRVGYMMQIMDYQPNYELSNFFNSVKHLIKEDKQKYPSSLLPGFDYHQINQEWFIRVP